MSKKYYVGGYVKLAKLWERCRSDAIRHHREYYEKKYKNNDDDMELIDVYIDITGGKHIYQRPEMLRLLRDCNDGKVNCIVTQTHAYLAANMEELCYLIKFLDEMPYKIDIVTEIENYGINTITNDDQQMEAMHTMAERYADVRKHDFELWKIKMDKALGGNKGR